MAAALDPNDPRWVLVNEIVQSPIFEKSPRMRSFLLFVCELELTGQRRDVNEQNIGVHVFGRSPNYNPGDDSIVRSQARFLRQRLTEYFNTLGANTPIRIGIPKGSYVPVFEEQVGPRLLTSTESAPDEAPIAPVAPRKISRLLLWMIASLVLLLALLVVYWHHKSGTPENRFWSSLFNPERTQVIVPADSSLILIEELSGHEVSFESYVNRSYLAPQDHSAVPSALPFLELGRTHYTSMADLGLVALLVRVPQAERSKVEIRNARELSFSDTRERNLFLIGGSRANPWVNLYSPHMNFNVDFDPVTHQNRVTNRAPQKGESSFYTESTGEHRMVYGVVAYQASLDHLGHSLLVAGTSSAGTQASADFLLNSKVFPAFLKKIQQPNGSIPHFEVLLGASTVNGNATDSNIVAFRLTD